MSWWEVLQKANKLDIAKEMVKVVCKSVPGAGAIASTIEGIEKLENKETQAKADAILGTIAENGKDILDLVQHIQGDSVAARLEILARFPGMEQKFTSLGQTLGGHLADLKQTLEQGIADIKKMLVDLKDEMHSFKQSRRLSRRASVVDSLSIMPHERERVREFLRKLRQIQQTSLVDATTKSEMGTLVSAIGLYDEAGKLYSEAISATQDTGEQALLHYNRFTNSVLAKDFTSALASYRKSLELYHGRTEWELFPLQQYEPREILGAGGFGIAFRCQEITGREVVVKSLLDICDKQAVIREAGVLQDIRSPYIIETLGYGCYQMDWGRCHNPYLVMAYFPGPNLQTCLDAKGPFALERGVEIARAIAQGMQTAHGMNVIHRDLKPANVLYRENGSGFDLKIIDFGLALRGRLPENQERSLRSKAKSDQSIVEKDIAGTFLYAPPEQMGELNVPVGPYSDVYSFGMTLKAILFGQLKPTAKMIRDFPNQALVDLIDECEQSEPKNRLQNFGEVLVRLGKIGGQSKKVMEEKKQRDEEIERLRREREALEQERTTLAQELKEQRAETTRIKREQAEAEARRKQEDAERQAEVKRQEELKRLEDVTRQAELKRKQEESLRWVENSSDSRFKKSREGVILDTKTNLEWYVGPDQDTNWNEAKSWTHHLTVDGGGWRMPTIAELRGLYQKSKGLGNMDPIFVTSGLFIWSCDDVTSSSACIFYFGNGHDDSYNRNFSHRSRVWSVRSRKTL